MKEHFEVAKERWEKANENFMFHEGKPIPEKN